MIQYGGIGALEGPQDCIEAFRSELRARRDLFYGGLADAAREVFSGRPPAGAFYAFLRINPAWTDVIRPAEDRATGGSRVRTRTSSLSWTMVEHLIKNGRIGCVPGVDFGGNGEGYVRFCFARERKELTGALESMRTLFGVTV